MTTDGRVSPALPSVFTGESDGDTLFSLTPTTQFTDSTRETRLIGIERIVVPENRRRLSSSVDLTESIALLGLLNPLTVTAELRLVAGLRRLEAVKRLGWKQVPCRIVALTGLRAELAEIDENVARNEPTLLERAQLLRRRKEVYEALHPEAKAGAKRARGMNRSLGNNVGAESAPTFTADAAAKMRVSERVVQEELKLADDLDDQAKDDLRDTPIADNKAELKVLAREDPQIQRKAARKLKDRQARNVAEAVGQCSGDVLPAAVVDDGRAASADRSKECHSTSPEVGARDAALEELLRVWPHLSVSARFTVMAVVRAASKNLPIAR